MRRLVKPTRWSPRALAGFADPRGRPPGNAMARLDRWCCEAEPPMNERARGRHRSGWRHRRAALNSPEDAADGNPSGRGFISSGQATAPGGPRPEPPGVQATRSERRRQRPGGGGPIPWSNGGRRSRMRVTDASRSGPLRWRPGRGWVEDWAAANGVVRSRPQGDAERIVVSLQRPKRLQGGGPGRLGRWVGTGRLTSTLATPTWIDGSAGQAGPARTGTGTGCLELVSARCGRSAASRPGESRLRSEGPAT